MRGHVLLSVVTAAALLASGACSDDEPTGPDDAVRTMLLETCAPGADPASDPVCRCSFDGLLERYGAEELERLDLQLRSDPEALPADARRIVLDCAFAVVDPTPPSTAPTTATSTDDTSDSTTTTRRSG